MRLRLTFLGGAGTVTGSKHLLTIGNENILIDCGLFQGLKEERLLNWRPLPIEAHAIRAVILTHAHLDHSGYLPLLVKNGFRGPIFCSKPTAELAKLVLLDSARLQEEDADHANRNHYSKHRPALPLYDTEDAERAIRRFQPVDLGNWQDVIPEVASFRLTNSGHILGSTFIEIKAAGKRLFFSGDLGRENPITLNPRAIISDCDYLVVESTYGDRVHPAEPPSEALARIINATHSQGGQTLIPTFAIGRTQDVLHLIARLKTLKKIPNIPVFLDSPMGDRATSVFDRYPHWHRLSSPDLAHLSQTAHHVSSPLESAALCQSRTPSIVIAGSGMLTGGRIRHHIAARISGPENTVLLTGYQAAGTLGRFLKEGASEIKLFGNYLPVRARVDEISSLSAHADQHEILNWMSGLSNAPKTVYINHGEPHASEGLRVRITDRFGYPVKIAKRGESHDL